MIVPDLNLLLYAHITAFPQHERAKHWWEQTVNGPVRVGLAPPVVFGFLRLATHRKVFAPPLDVAGAIARVEGWLRHPNVQLLIATPRHVTLTLALLLQAGTAANLTTDAQIAAHAIEHNALLCSNDADFARFAGLKWENPLAA